MQFLKNTILYFYFKNFIWNLKFWLFCKPKYKEITYIKVDPNKMERQKLTKKRFEGYLYKDKTYLDNPGLTLSKENWKKWKLFKKF